MTRSRRWLVVLIVLARRSGSCGCGARRGSQLRRGSFEVEPGKVQFQLRLAGVAQPIEGDSFTL